MDFIKKEIELAQQVELLAKEVAVTELVELQLAMVGGGLANEIFG